MAGPTACGKRWGEILASFERNLCDLIAKHPTCIEEIKLIQAGLITIGQLINDSPRGNGNGTAWREITTRAEAERAVLCKHLEGKALLTAILHLYATAHKELRDTILPEPEQKEPNEEFREQRRRKRNPSDDEPAVPKKTSGTSGSIRPQGDLPTTNVVTTRNFYAPLRAAEMETDPSTTEGSSSASTASAKPGRPPPIILTSAVNLIQLQKQLKNVVEENFEFRSTRNGTRVMTKSLADFQSVKSLFDSQLLSYFTFFLKTEKPIKAVIRHLPINTPAEDISDRLVNLGFDVVSVKQMTTARWSSPEGPKITNLPPFPSYPAQDGKIPRNFLSAKPLPHRDQGRGIQGPEWPYAVSQLPAVQPRLGKTANNLPAVYGTGAATCTKSAQRRGTQLPPQHAVTADCRKEKNPIPPIIMAAGMPRRSCKRRRPRSHPKHNGEDVLFHPHHSRCVLRGGAPWQDSGPAATSGTSGGGGNSWRSGTGCVCTLTAARTATNRQLVSAINHVHSQEICHRDLKCENVLLAREDCLKLTDFGFAMSCQDDNGNRIRSLTNCGSLSYTPPEVIQELPYELKLADTWSLSCILFAMLIAEMLFGMSNVPETNFKTSDLP